MVFFTELEQIISQFVWKYKKTQIAKAILRKKNETGGKSLPDFRLYLQSYSPQDSMVLAQRQKYRSMEQNRKPRDNPHNYGHLIVDKELMLLNCDAGENSQESPGQQGDQTSQS